MKSSTRREEGRERSGRAGRRIVAAIVLIAAGMAGMAHASEVWRCGGGYSDRPCDNGSLVKAADDRSDADRRAADAATRRLEARGDKMAHDRLAQERQARDGARRDAAEARRAAIDERKVAVAEATAKAKLDAQLHKPSGKVGGAASEKPAKAPKPPKEPKAKKEKKEKEPKAPKEPKAGKASREPAASAGASHKKKKA